MDLRLRNFYVESRVKNASPGERLVMLYDALVEHAENAEAQMAAPGGTAERALAPLSVARCIDILTELNGSLRPEFDAELCANLNKLYRFFTRELSAALGAWDAKKIEAILPLLRDLKATWTKAQKISSQAQFASQAHLVSV